MEFGTYQKFARETASPIPEKPVERLAIAALGLNGEAGEFAEHIKKVIAQGHPLDSNYLIKEIGDILWYCSYAADVIGVKLDEIAMLNLNKLKERYPEGFSSENSQFRKEGRESYESMK